MKRKLLTIIAIQGILILVLLVFSMMEKAEADRQHQLAKHNEQLAREQVAYALQLREQLAAEVKILRAELARLKDK